MRRNTVAALVTAAVLLSAWIPIPPVFAQPGAELEEQLEGRFSMGVWRQSGITQDILVVGPLDTGQWKAAAADASGKIDWPRWFKVHPVADADGVADVSEMPHMMGSYAVDARFIMFTPRFPLQPGLNYRLEFIMDPAAETGAALRAATRTAIVSIAQTPEQNTAPNLEHIYPTAPVLPENLLKFYLQFSQPMASGDVYRHIHLFNGEGSEVELPFLELGEELWDRDKQRLTLFIDPGRIKREVKPLEDIGPALEAGGRYTLRIDGDWSSAWGAPLGEPVTKTFDVGPAIRTPIDLAQWKISPPAAATRAPLQIEFDRPLDFALASRVIRVRRRDASVAGAIVLAAHERQWVFTPDTPWQPGSHRLRIGAELEDLAGNNVGKAFETQLQGDTPQSPDEEFYHLDFTIPPPETLQP